MHSKTKRIIAWIAIILLVSLYLITLILAIAGVSIYNSMFVFSLFATLVVPLLAFIIIWLYDRFNDHKAPGDPTNSDN